MGLKYTYVAQYGTTNAFKIGSSMMPHKRCEKMNSELFTNYPFLENKNPIHIRYISKNAENTEYGLFGKTPTENKLHEALKSFQMKTNGIGKEWFYIEKEKLNEFLQKDFNLL